MEALLLHQGFNGNHCSSLGCHLKHVKEHPNTLTVWLTWCKQFDGEESALSAEWLENTSMQNETAHPAADWHPKQGVTWHCAPCGLQRRYNHHMVFSRSTRLHWQSLQSLLEAWEPILSYTFGCLPFVCMYVHTKFRAVHPTTPGTYHFKFLKSILLKKSLPQVHARWKPSHGYQAL